MKFPNWLIAVAALFGFFYLYNRSAKSSALMGAQTGVAPGPTTPPGGLPPSGQSMTGKRGASYPSTAVRI